MLQLIVDGFVYGVLKFPAQAKWAQAVNFFFYDSIKITLLLFCLVTVIGFLRSFLPQQKIRQWLTKSTGWGNFFASLFGAVTPFCSCSSIPIFFSFIKAQIPLGIAFSFLITSPIINEYLVVLMFGFFGWKITLAYVASGIVIGVGAGIILGRMRLEKYLVQDLIVSENNISKEIVLYKNIKDRLIFGMNEALSIIRKLWIWILVGVGIGALIHNYVPQEMIQTMIGKTGIFSVPMATIIGVPLYGSCAAILPIAIVLFQKGLPLGTALAFMMAVSALSLPEAIMLRRVMKLKLIAIFFATISSGIIIIGYLFNLLQKILV